MKYPLTLLTVCFGYLFLSGMFAFEVSEDLTTLLGLGVIAGLVWSWVVALK